jgi:ABC-type sugar transport system ATPase subunit
MAEVRLIDVNKKFETAGTRRRTAGETAGVLAVNQLNLTIQDGEFLVLLGPSGCGKTTTLRMIAGLETATSGQILIGDREVNQLPPGDRDIAFVFQFYALYPHLSVIDNITFPLRAQKLPPDEIAHRVARVARLLRIDHILKRRPNRLPSGEQQRVALGRAIVRQPQVFLMDEPLTNLDASLRAEMRVELKHLQQELGTTMVYVTHDQTEAMSMSHRIAVMNLGVLQQVGTPLEIYNRPQTLFVASFIGSPPMNLIPARLHDGRQIASETGPLRLDLNGHRVHADSAQDGARKVLLGVRSEDMQLADDSDEADVSGVVTVREPLGDETIYQVETEAGALLVKTPPRIVRQPGDRVGLTIDRRRIHLFDRATEHSLLV